MKTITLLVLLTATTVVMAQPDNRYCGAGDVPRFGAERDGPAALPTRCINTALASTPSPGKVIRVSGRTDVEAALLQAACAVHQPHPQVQRRVHLAASVQQAGAVLREGTS